MATLSYFTQLMLWKGDLKVFCRLQQKEGSIWNMVSRGYGTSGYVLYHEESS